MKKIFIVLALAISYGAFGQFNTGSVYFSGMTTGNLGTGLNEGQFYIPFEIGVEGGYFLKNKIALGGKIHTHGEIFFNGGSSYELTLGPTIRYYRATVKDFQMYYYGHIFYGFWNGSNNQTGFQTGVGFDYFLTERIAVEAKILYHYTRQWYSDAFSGTTFGFNNHNLLFELGISVFFPSLTFFDKS